MEVVSHRGNCCGGAENSLVAIERAWGAEADAIEVDLRMSKDKVIVLFHDRKINGKPISMLSFEEIQAINSEVPALDSLLSSKLPSGYYIFDLKEYTHEYINSLSKTISNTKFPENKIVFQSNDMASLSVLREKHPNSQFAYLSKLKRSTSIYKVTDPVEIKKYLSRYNINRISIKGRKFLDKEYIQAIKEGEIKVFVWTINSIERAKYYSDLGVSGVITDKVIEVKRANKSIQPTR